MKAILSYGNYFSFGKHYQVKFIYDNELEAEYISSYLQPLHIKKIINPYYKKLNLKRSEIKSINIIDKTNIPKEILISFISTLMNIDNCKIIIGQNELSRFDLDNIQEEIDKLHINATLNKGDFFTIGNTYYITFKYANESQKDEISYFFNCKLNLSEQSEIWIATIDKQGNFTSKSNGTIIGANIPKLKLSRFIKTFIEDYDMVITIGNEKLKEKFNEEELNKAIESIDKETGRSRKRTMQGTI